MGDEEVVVVEWKIRQTIYSTLQLIFSTAGAVSLALDIHPLFQYIEHPQGLVIAVDYLQIPRGALRGHFHKLALVALFGIDPGIEGQRGNNE